MTTIGITIKIAVVPDTALFPFWLGIGPGRFVRLPGDRASGRSQPLPGPEPRTRHLTAIALNHAERSPITTRTLLFWVRALSASRSAARVAMPSLVTDQRKFGFSTPQGPRSAHDQFPESAIIGQGADIPARSTHAYSPMMPARASPVQR